MSDQAPDQQAPLLVETRDKYALERFLRQLADKRVSEPGQEFEIASTDGATLYIRRKQTK